MRRFSFASYLAVMSLVCGSWIAASAQAVQDRIVQEINPSQTAVLKGSVNPRIAQQTAMGSLQAGTEIDGITMTFQPTAEQKAELDALVKAQQTPGSPEYHQWLMPAEYGARFGLTDDDLQSIETWLGSQGFNVERVSPSRTSITFSGTVEQVETAFQTRMSQYLVDGEEHWANATNLSVPAALEGIVQSVEGLNDFRPRPQVRPASLNALTATPAFTSSVSGNHYLTPDDVATIYDMNPVYQSGYDGAGITLAVVGQSAVSASDITNFQSAAGVPVRAPNLNLVPDTGSSTVNPQGAGDEAESDLDLEYASGTARGATIAFYYTGNSSNSNVFNALEYAIDNDVAPVISISYGACETQFNSSSYAAMETELEKGAAQGQSIVASSGDDGSTSCYGLSGMTTAQQEALAVNYPASSAYATGVGGTEFPAADVAASNTQYWESASGSDVISSALSYIPEQVWNDDADSSKGQKAGVSAALSSGGGGVSALTARPSWQTGVPGIPAGSNRLVPDISLASSAEYTPYLYCTSDTSAWSQGQTASCNSGFRDSSTKDLTAAGGTSFAAPIFAGMVAVLDQRTNSGKGVGVAAAELYTLASNTSTYAAAFHDITSGGNQCTAGSTFCSSAGQSEYAAGPGYDEASGLGSVDFGQLVTAWSGGGSGTLLDSSTTTVTAASATENAGVADAITIAVTPASSSVTATPTGTVAITVNGAAVTTLTLTNGSATYSFSETVNGSYTIAAAYSGDSTFSSSTGSTTVTVQGGTNPPSFGVSANPAAVTVAQAGSGPSTITVTSQNGYAGTVNFTLVPASQYTGLSYGCYALGGVQVAANGTATGTLTIYTSQSQCTSLGSGVLPLSRPGTSGGTAHNRSPLGKSVPISAAALGGLLLLGFRRPRSRLWTTLGCVMLMAAIGGFASGCGSTTGATVSGSGSGTTSTNVPSGTYTLTLEGVDSANSSLTASTSLTLTVN